MTFLPLSNDYVRSLLILAGTILLAKVFYHLLHTYIHKLTVKTKTDIDDLIFKIIKKPFYVLIIFVGAFLSLRSLPVLAAYGNWLKGTFFVVSLLTISLIVSRVLSVFVSRWFKVQKQFEKTPKLVKRVVSIIIFLIALLMILAYFKIEITPLVATLGLGGLAIGLALQATLSNFFAGLHIISDKPINPGDFIELPDSNVSGYVEDISWRSTRIRTLPNQIVIVPNAKLADTIIVNDSLPEKEMAALVQVGVSYESDLRKVEKVTVEVARKIQKTVPGAVKSFEPFIRYHTFGDSNINFTVVLRVENYVDKHLVTHEFIKALKERYDKEGIEISWPVRKVYQAR